MTNEIFPTELDNILLNVRTGMPVYDWNKKKIGKVKAVYPPSTTAQASETMAERLFDETSLDRAPSVVRKRLANSGFIQVNAGFFRKDYYITSDQMGSVADEGVMLNVHPDNLIQY